MCKRLKERSIFYQSMKSKHSHKKQQAQFDGRMKVPIQIELITKIQGKIHMAIIIIWLQNWLWWWDCNCVNLPEIQSTSCELYCGARDKSNRDYIKVGRFIKVGPNWLLGLETRYIVHRKPPVSRFKLLWVLNSKAFPQNWSKKGEVW